MKMLNGLKKRMVKKQAKNPLQVLSNIVFFVCLSCEFSCVNNTRTIDNNQLNDIKPGFYITMDKGYIYYDSLSNFDDEKTWCHFIMKYINLTKDTVIVENSRGTGIVSNFYIEDSNEKHSMKTNHKKTFTIPPNDSAYLSITYNGFYKKYNYSDSTYLKNIFKDIEHSKIYFEGLVIQNNNDSIYKIEIDKDHFDFSSIIGPKTQKMYLNKK